MESLFQPYSHIEEGGPRHDESCRLPLYSETHRKFLEQAMGPSPARNLAIEGTFINDVVVVAQLVALLVFVFHSTGTRDEQFGRLSPVSFPHLKTSTRVRSSLHYF